jgi:hypothetical protein
MPDRIAAQTGWVTSIALGVALLCGSPRAEAQTTTTPPAASLAAQVAGKVLITAQHYTESTNGAMTANLWLGYYRLAADGRATRSHYLFLPANNSPGILTTNLRTPMTPKGDGNPGQFRIPAHAGHVASVATTWSATAAAIEFRNGDGTIETWHLEKPDRLLFLLQSITHGTATIGANAYGVAMLSDDIAPPGNRPMRLEDLRASYRGVVFHKQNGLGMTALWARPDSEFNPSLLSAPPGYLNSYGFTQYDAGQDSYVQFSLLLNHAPENHSILYYEYGHDFDKNLCFDEVGHTSMFWTVWRGGIADGVVGIEYSYQDSGYPMLTVAGYY